MIKTKALRKGNDGTEQGRALVFADQNISITKDGMNKVDLQAPLPANGMVGFYEIQNEIVFDGSESIVYSSPRLFTVMPHQIAGNISQFDFDNCAIVTSLGDEEIAGRLSSALNSAQILPIEGLTAGELLPVMQRNNLILLGGHISNELVNELINLGKIAASQWTIAGDASIEVVDDPFPGIAPSTNKAIVVAGFEQDDTYVAGLKLMKYLSSSLAPPALSSPANNAPSQPTTLSLAWTDTNLSPQEAGYKIRIKPEGGAYAYYPVGQDVTYKELTNLALSTTYNWNVQALGDGANTLDSPWANGGADWSFTTSAGSLVSEINVKQGTTDIPSGGLSDFGARKLGQTTQISFAIENTGEAQLDLNGSPIIIVQGLNAPEFSVHQQPVSPVNPDGSTVFIITFTPTTIGPNKQAYIDIMNTDSNENPYRINFTGTGLPSRKVDVDKDGQEDILWRYYGGGEIQGWNVAWLMHQSEAPLPQNLGIAQVKPEGMSTQSGTDPGASHPNPMAADKASASKPKKVYLTPQVGRASATAPRSSMRHASDIAKGTRTVGSAPAMTITGLGTMKITALESGAPVTLPTVQDTLWELAGAGDFDRDGNTDLLWRYYGSGDQQGLTVIWYMNGTEIDRYGFLPTVQDTDWRIEGTGDFNGDGILEILWRYYGTGDFQGWNIVWYLNGTEISDYGFPPAVTDLNWKVAGIGDFDGDGKAEPLLRYDGPGEFQGLNIIWYLDGMEIASYGFPPRVDDLTWKMDGAGDFDGDGKTDLLWRNYGPALQGWTVIWYMNGATPKGLPETLTSVYDINWRIVNR